jgi:uncharacterized protein YoxC
MFIASSFVRTAALLGLFGARARLYTFDTSFTVAERGKVRLMAQQNKQKDLLTRLSDVGEEAISRVAGSQTTTRLMESVGGMRERLDDLQKKVRGLDELEKRVAKLEKRVADLSKPKRATASRSRSTASRKKTTASTRKKPTT